MIRAVLFDLDETLIPEDEPLAAAYRPRALWIQHGGSADLSDLSRLPALL